MLHCFSEIDIETETPLSREVFQKLFNQCEQIGFFCEQSETEKIEFTGPFNVPDNWTVKFVLLWNITRKQIKEAYFEIQMPNEELMKFFKYHFLQGEVEIELEELQFA